MRLALVILSLLATATLFGQPSDSVAVAAKISQRTTPKRITSLGGSMFITAGITELLKNSVHELRPDRSENNSFPSRHTSWAFGFSTALSNQLYQTSPWLAMGSHGAASAIALQRVASGRHWGSDVAAGAAIGIVSAEIAQCLSRLIFHGKSPWHNSPEYAFAQALSLSSEVIYWINGNNTDDWRTAYATALRYRNPINDSWAISIAAEAMSMPVKIANETSPLTGVCILCGGAKYFSLSNSPLGIVTTAEVGAIRWLGPHQIRPQTWNFTARIENALEWNITKSFSTKGAIGLRSLNSSHFGIDISVASIATF